MYILMFVNVKFTNLHEQDSEKQIGKKLPRLSLLLIKDSIYRIFSISVLPNVWFPQSLIFIGAEDKLLIFTRNWGFIIRTTSWIMIIRDHRSSTQMRI